MQSKEAKAFDLSLEKADSRSRPTAAAASARAACWPAGWSKSASRSSRSPSAAGTRTRTTSNASRTCPARSTPVAALVSDLKDRGLLDSTLVIWMGEFGRTPNINTRGAKPGRDHYPRAWSLLMIGGGIKGGTVIGRTDKEGATVEEGKTDAKDFMATVCDAAGHRLQQGKRDADQAADPHRRQARQAGDGGDWVEVTIQRVERSKRRWGCLLCFVLNSHARSLPAIQGRLMPRALRRRRYM